MHRGPAGAGNLNSLLQEALTPHRDGTPEKRYGGRVSRGGDKVTQLRNNYDKGRAGIFNGTAGVVTGLSLEQQTLTVRTDEDELVDYDFGELAHAYAVTIHRSQGSEYPALVIPLTTSSWTMLQHNLLYTGLTRARKLIVLAGSRRALAQAVRTPGAGRRHTALTYRLNPRRAGDLTRPAPRDSSSRRCRIHPRAQTGWIRQDEADRSEPDDRPTTQTASPMRRLRRRPPSSSGPARSHARREPYGDLRLPYRRSHWPSPR
jgi:hypothetical protein